MDGVTALMHATTLGHLHVTKVMMEANQAGSVTIDMNAQDDNGHTALAHAQVNTQSNKTMDTNAKSKNNCKLRQQSITSTRNNNSGNSNQLSNNSTSANIDKIRDLLESYNEGIANDGCLGLDGYGNVSKKASPKKMFSPNEGIELIDMTSSVKNKRCFTTNQVKNDTIKNSDNKNRSQIKKGEEIGHGEGRENYRIEEAESSVDRNNEEIQRWASDLKQEHTASGRVSSLMSAHSSGIASRPSSRLGTGKGSSVLDRTTPTPSGANTKARPPLKSSVSESEVCATNFRNTLKVDRFQCSVSDDDDEELSLQSLSELVGTVRQYAQEIRDIYAPIQKEEEERIKRRNEMIERRKQKALQKKLSSNSLLKPDNVFRNESSAGNTSNNNGSFHPEVVIVEIHKMEDDPKHARKNEPSHQQTRHQLRGRHKSQGPIMHSKSHEPHSGRGTGIEEHPLASLHVENEQLSSTWPRGRQRPKSRDRFKGDMHVHAKQGDDNLNPQFHGSNSSIASAPNPGNFAPSRPRIPSDWNEEVSLEHERGILNKAYKNMVRNNEDPLLTALRPKKTKNVPIEDQMMNSRQSVIQLGKAHQQQMKAQSEIPSISIIPPPGGDIAGHGPVISPASTSSSKGAHQTSFGRDAVFPTGNSNLPNGPRRAQFNSTSGNNIPANSSGLRRRKSVDQGLGNNVVLDKY